MQTLRVACIGFGHAGQALAKIILKMRQEIAQKYGWQLEFVAIATATRGNLVNLEGLDLEAVLAQLKGNGYFDPNQASWSSLTSLEIIEQVDYDVLIEITPLQIFSGQPAISYLQAAMRRHKHVITANKGPLAWAFQDLNHLARERQVHFLYETTVMDGTPVFNLVEETLPGCRITGVRGILNTTTNYLLEEMAAGNSYEEALCAAQQAGFVESDPSLDVDGWDAAAKTAVLLNVLMQAQLTPLEIERTGIGEITLQDIEQAKREGKVIKLLCEGSKQGEQIRGWVKPVAIDQHDLLASVSGTSSVLTLKTDLMGDISIFEHQPSIAQTGYGLFSDLLRLLKLLKGTAGEQSRA